MKRIVLVVGSLALLAIAWLAPLQHVMGPFSAHMTAHMLVVAVASPLIALALEGTRLDPVRHVPRAFSPIAASVVELFVVWAWHTPSLHALARSSHWAMALEQGSFLASGLLLWCSAVGIEAEAPRARVASGVVAMLLTTMHMTLLGALIALSPRVLYGHAHTTSGHAGHHDPLADQHLGGAIMLLVGGLSYLIGGLLLTVPLVRAVRQGARS